MSGSNLRHGMCLCGVLLMFASQALSDTLTAEELWNHQKAVAIAKMGDNYYNKPNLVVRKSSSNHINADYSTKAKTNSSALPFVVLLVMSRPEALHERMAIRRTWTQSAASCQVKIIFAFGGRYRLQQLRVDVAEEQRAFHDVVVFEQIKDKYYETFELVLHALALARQTYPTTKFFAKANDDVWLNFPKIVQILTQPHLGRDFILGNFLQGDSSAAQEYYEKFTYSPKGSLQFAVGHLWIMPGYTLDKILRMALFEVPKTTLVADIVLTGEFRQHGNIPTRQVEGYVDLWDLRDRAGCELASYPLVHGVFSQKKYKFDGLKCLHLRCHA